MDWSLLMPIRCGADWSEDKGALWMKANSVTHFDTPAIRSLP
jgi:hypothetical protein